MPDLTPTELKKALQAQGFEIYRTNGSEVQIADRVRDNLLMDSAVSVRAGEPLVVRVVVRAQASDFPTESESLLFARARRCAEPAQNRGFRETGTKIVPIADPGDRTRTLDTWYEVYFERPLGEPAELERELRVALAFEKSARPRP
jgi:predicted RNA binding protein YcfA (HicA-like mRNA interferase family)